MLKQTVYSEPMFDDETLDIIEEQKTSELIRALLRYTKKLKAMVIDLRTEVNSLTPVNKPAPYADIHSDIYEVFYDYPGYSKYEEIFEEVLNQD